MRCGSIAVLKEGRGADGDLESVQRWTAKRRTALLLQILKSALGVETLAKTGAYGFATPKHSPSK
jgi:hypothetical protein